MGMNLPDLMLTPKLPFRPPPPFFSRRRKSEETYLYMSALV